MTINNNNIFGAFTLGEIRSGRLTGDWLNKESVANYGWFGGGQGPAFPTPFTASTVDRIDFSNDSVNALPRGPLSSARYSAGATGNSNYGWFGGGAFPVVSIVDRIDFSSDSSTASVRGSLTSNRRYLTATGNSNYGWFGGGFLVSTVDRIDFSNDSGTASVRGPLSSARLNSTTTANSNYGWFAAGSSPAPIYYSSVDRIDFSNDFSTASPRGPLTLARNLLASTGNSNYGWFGGGYAPTSTRSTVDRIDFSNDLSKALVRGSLNPSVGRQNLAATGNSNYGWFGGGLVPASPTPLTVSTVDRIDFSNDSVTASLRGGVLSRARYGLRATSGVLNIRAQKAGNYGWFGGGLIPTPAVVSTVDRIDFSNDLATQSPRGFLSAARYSAAATGNSNYGWFGGGFVPAPVPTYPVTVSRIDFSNDSPTSLSRGSLTLGRYGLAATGNSNYGWFAAGSSPGPIYYSTVDRINFSNDLAAASPRGPLFTAKNNIAATGNSNYGWFGGGFDGSNPSAIVDRIDFSNDSPTASVRSPLFTTRQSLGATGNSNYGWFGGGFDGSNPSAIVDRINFSNDLTTTSPRGPLSFARFILAATGNSNYGWFGGGYTTTPPGRRSTVDRIDFSNDSVSASVRSSLNAPAGRSGLAATSNTNK